MEKALLLFLFSFMASTWNAQIIVRFLDADKKEAIDNVFLVNKNGETVSISNLKGECFILTRDMGTLKASHLSYKPLLFKSEKDTVIYLKGSMQEVDPVTIKGMSNETLFRRILELSGKQVKKQGLKLEGTYFEMAYYIMEENHDTVQVIFTADLEAVLPDEKKSEYAYYISGEKKYLSDLSQVKTKFDTAQYNRSMALVGFIDNELEKMDLRKVKDIKLKNFEKSKRFTDSIPFIEFSRSKQDWENKYRFYYDGTDSLLLRTSYTSSSDKVYNGENMWIDFSYYSSVNHYERSPLYFLRLITLEREINLITTGKRTRIIGVKAYLVKQVTAIDAAYKPAGKKVKNLFRYSSDFPATDEKLPVLIKQTRF